ncbi:hypothetical protein D1007_45977 [Hordeum vulgare]|nr:hypothetical protein D1007_45977 [Hordeum vulgare]
MAPAAAKPGDGGHSTVGDGTGDDDNGEYSKVDNWLGSGSFAMQSPVLTLQHTPPVTPETAPPSPDNQQFSLEYTSARALARAVAADPSNSH